ncbi:MAG: hypothetical protein A4E65_00013 [Syntrophorhabdus sp. PtaU1.Bin153]|nr:MAG: hypothetical protein A4E65_00013 [Syntrophorhabdus sp. PtaU1.Bin153]
MKRGLIRSLKNTVIGGITGKIRDCAITYEIYMKILSELTERLWETSK